jgi:hypothetical protein
MLWKSTMKTASKVLCFVAALIIILLFVWHVTFDNVAVHRNISLAPEVVNKNFRLNYTGSYSMGIEVERKFPHAVLQCLIGIRGPELLDPAVCGYTPAVLKYSWELRCAGRIVQTGTSDKIVGGRYTTDTMEAMFAYFEGKRGDHCQLALSFIQDGSKLSVANPELHIYTELF